MKKTLYRPISILLFAILIFTGAVGAYAQPAPAAASASAGKPSLAKTVFAPGEIPETKLVIAQRGRYSIQAKSPTGTAITIIDRMAGVLGSDGVAGEKDGRVDLILETGEYKVKLALDPESKSQAVLSVVQFRESNPGATPAELPMLYDGDFIQTNLDDLTTRSYWIYFEEKAELRLEIMGRTFKECSVWQNGQWLMNLKPAMSTREPVSGRPMQYAEFYQNFEPGHYLFVIAGGSPAAWPNEAKEYPLYIRRGIAYLGEQGIRSLTISPFGRDVYLVAQTTNYFECIRKDLLYTRMATGVYNANQTRHVSARTAIINKESALPNCSIEGSSYGNRQQLLSMEAAPGDKIEVRFFKSAHGSHYVAFRESDTPVSYLITSIPSIEAENTFDFTPLLVDTYSRKMTLIKDLSMHVSGSTPYIRKVNLLGFCSVYVYIEETGDYKIAESAAAGAAGRYRFRRVEDVFFSSQIPSYQTVEKPWKLVPGFYLMEVEPVKAGILHFALYKDGSQSPQNLLAKPLQDPVVSFIWPGVALGSNDYSSKYLYYNSRYDTQVGLSMRELPVNPAEPFSFYLPAGETVNTELRIDADSVLFVEGAGYDCTVSGKKLDSSVVFREGKYAFQLKNTGSSTAFFSVYSLSKKAVSRTPRPVMKPLEESFPILTEAGAWFGDFDRGETKKLLLRVTEPGLYRIETTGRLAMGLSIQTALVPTLGSASENTAGRNALIARYTRPGDYLVSVTARGRSMGRAGVVLRRTEIINEGELAPDVVSRKTVAADSALQYTLKPAETGDFTIYSFGLGIQFPFRLEDSEGFPLVAEGRTGGSMALRKEVYYYYSLPLTFESRRLTRFTQVKQPETREGKTFDLFLNKSQSHTWRETPDRSPDVYKLVVTAPVNANISVSEGMTATLIAAGKEPVKLDYGKSLSTDLAAGSYEIHVQAKEAQNLLEYKISVSTTELIPGMSCSFPSSPVSVVISTGNDAVYDLWTFGFTDVKASLWDAQEKTLIATADDRENDWNFRITQRLAPGRYLLKIDRIGSASGSVTLYLDETTRQQAGAVKLPLSLERNIAKEVVEFPFTMPDDGIFLVKSERGSGIRFALYNKDRLCGQAQDFLAVPLVKNTQYTLHVWQDLDVPQQVKVTGQIVASKTVVLGETLQTLAGSQAFRLSNPMGLSYIFTPPQTGAVLYFSPGFERPLKPVEKYALALTDSGFVLNRDLSMLGNVGVQPLVLAAGKPATVFIEDVNASFLLESQADRIFLVEGSSQGSPAGVMLLPRSAYKPDRVAWRGISTTQTRAITTAPSAGKYQGRVWNLRTYTNTGAVRVNLSARGFNVQEEKKLVMGQGASFTIKPEAGVRVYLPAGPQEISLLLEKGCYAGIWNNGNPLGIAGADQENTDVRLSVDGGVVVIMNTGKEPALARVSSAAAAVPRSFTITGTGNREIQVLDSGMMRVTVEPAGTDGTLSVAGSVVSAILRGNDGIIYTGTPAGNEQPFVTFPGKGGELEINYDPGIVKVWNSGRGQEIAAGAGRTGRPASKQISAGTALLENAAQVWTFQVTEPGFAVITLRAAGVAAFYMKSEAVSLSLSATAGERTIIRFLDKGSYEIFTRPLEGLRQEGSLTLNLLTPVTIKPPEEKVSYLIGKNEVQAFVFTVKDAANVGVGLGTDADAVYARLYDKNSRFLGEGTLLFRELVPGEYFLLVQGREQAVRITPLVYGNIGLKTDVPQDVLDGYRQ